ncbi:hypothetical protein C8N36_1038 [Pelagimonas varians]|uniref:Uncharacterized protein n=1 Tax=Pelagimonas varians TaxID=696760 RepID=A0A238KH23_9RHOB|nr:hypothetical protein C8N36_1038 [Pelagimonas varians]SMX42129.1 hypothetical protein PEV8663_02422 [Pelagimonas varians]
MKPPVLERLNIWCPLNLGGHPLEIKAPKEFDRLPRFNFSLPTSCYFLRTADLCGKNSCF